jgi:hypothetical protein
MPLLYEQGRFGGLFGNTFQGCKVHRLKVARLFKGKVAWDCKVPRTGSKGVVLESE